MEEKNNKKDQSRYKEFLRYLKNKFAIDPLTKKRFERFQEIKRAKYSLIVIGVFYIISLFAELFASNRPLLMFVDGKLYFPTYSKILLANDFNFRVNDELELDYRAFKKHLSETKRGWLVMPLIPYNPYESDNAIAPLELTFATAPVLGLAITSKADMPNDDPSEYTWVPVGTSSAVKFGDSYVWVKFASSDKSNDMTDFPSNKKSWIGLAVGKSSPTESRTQSDYKWHKLGTKDNRVELGDDKVITVRYAKGDKGQMFHPLSPSFKTKHIMGTDRIGRDVFARMFYGFRIAMSFALIVAAVTYFIGTIIGIAMGYFGKTFDMLMQRFIEIWERIPYLYMIMILASIFKPTFLMFTLINIVFGWSGKTWSMRAMTYRERERDYILAAKSMGASTWRIITVHILPNVIVLIVTSLPFVISGNIGALTALDYLGYGLQAPTPSWGELLSVGTATYNEAPWILSSAVGGSVFVLVMITFIGEGLRDAFDPRRFTVYK